MAGDEQTAHLFPTISSDLRDCPMRTCLALLPLLLLAQHGTIAAEPPARGYTIPLIDLAGDSQRQVVVDREAGQYLGHPTTVLLEDGKTMLCVYPKGHGRGAICYKRSTDGGLTWSPRLAVPQSWSTSKETPTIHRVVDAAGKRRLIVWSGLYPARLAVSEADGQSWSELQPAGDWGGIVVMGFVEPLRNRPGEYLAMFHDDGRFFTSQPKQTKPVTFTLYKTFSRDGGLTWSQPEAVFSRDDVHLCEPGVVRSPDGKELAVLLRENSRRRNSHIIFSRDEGATWTAPRELPGSLTGDRHVARYTPDGKLFISFRDTTLESSTRGDWVAWVGEYDDLVQGREGLCRIRLMKNHKGADCAYPGVEVLPDGTLVATTYGHWTEGEQPYIVSVRVTMDEILDRLARQRSASKVSTTMQPTSSRFEDWPQFRGPNCSGVSMSMKSLPTAFSQTLNVKWSTKLADGIGSPVVSAGRVFVPAMIDDHTVALHAFDAATGRQLWQRTWETGPLPEIHRTNSHAATTPAADPERVYFYFSSLGLVCVDARTGEDRWSYKLPMPYFVFKWGPGMSPVLHGERLIFCQDDDLSPALYVFDKRTGRVAWKDDRHDQCVNYSHPVVHSGPEGDELIVAGTGKVIGYDLATGERKWFARGLLRNIKTTPVYRDGVVYLSLQSGGIANQWIASIDQAKTGNQDGKITKAELQAFVGQAPVPEAFYQKTFDRGDKNGDGALEGAELDAAFLPPGNEAGARFDSKTPADEYILAIKAGGRGDVTDTHVLWRHATKHTDHIVSPLLAGGRMLLVKTGGILTTFETAQGEPLGSPCRIGNASGYFASPVFGDGKIYIAGDDGRVVVLQDDASLTVLATNDLGSPILATPAIADGRLYIRTREALYCLGE
jgi:outer membrane protein assembly factor BamB